MFKQCQKRKINYKKIPQNNKYKFKLQAVIIKKQLTKRLYLQKFQIAKCQIATMIDLLIVSIFVAARTFVFSILHQNLNDVQTVKLLLAKSWILKKTFKTLTIFT